MVQKDQSLKGKTVVITRPRGQAEETLKEIEARGGKPYLFPTIEIHGPTNLSAVKRFFVSLQRKRVDYVVLMSVNGVKHLLNAAERLGIRNKIIANLQNVITIAVGPKTAEEMKKNAIRVDLIPEKYTSESILQCFQERGVENKEIFIPRTREAPPDLAKKLREMGGRVEELYVYQSQLPRDVGLSEKFFKDLADGKIQAILFSSSLGARNFFAMLEKIVSHEELVKILNKKTVVVAIGPTTANTLIEASIRVDVTPGKHTIDEALDALVAYWNSKELSG